MPSVAEAQRDAAAAGGGTAQAASGGEHRPAVVHAHDLAATAHHGRQVTQNDTGAAADLQHAIAGADRDEAQEAPP
jgi:hypothetical protein